MLCCLAGLKLLGSSNSPASASEVARIVDICLHVRLEGIILPCPPSCCSRSLSMLGTCSATERHSQHPSSFLPVVSSTWHHHLRSGHPRVILYVHSNQAAQLRARAGTSHCTQNCSCSGPRAAGAGPPHPLLPATAGQHSRAWPCGPRGPEGAERLALHLSCGRVEGEPSGTNKGQGCAQRT